MKTSHLQFDAIVVGSGPGGATVARELSQRNKRVLALEWGIRAPIKGSQWQFLSMTAVPGRSLLITSKLLSLVRGVTMGGSSIFLLCNGVRSSPGDAQIARARYFRRGR